MVCRIIYNLNFDLVSLDEICLRLYEVTIADTNDTKLNKRDIMPSIKRHYVTDPDIIFYSFIYHWYIKI